MKKMKIITQKYIPWKKFNEKFIICGIIYSILNL